MPRCLEQPPARSPQAARTRWLIAAMLFLAAVLNYIDRQTLSILAPTIQRDLGMDDRQYADIASIFLVAYTVSLLVSGRLIDKLGTRLGMALFVGFWSLANMATALTRSFASLAAFRFLLGLGEAGNWPASTKAVSEWFPAAQRGVAIGFYTMGATVGATIAPLLIVLLAGAYGWQAVFVVTGAVGLVWVVPWLLIYRLPPPSSAAAVAGSATKSIETVWPSEWSRWRSVLDCRLVWLLMFARMLTDPVWYFYQFWFAKYLFAQRGVSQESLGMTWVVFLAADLGSLAGGMASGWLIRRGSTPVAGRMRIMFLSACIVPLSPLVATVPTVGAALTVAMLVVLAHMAWLVNIGALLVDVIPTRLVATAFGVVAAGSALGGVLMNQTVGVLVTDYSYTHWFFIMAFLHPATWLLLWVSGVGRDRTREDVAECVT